MMPHVSAASLAADGASSSGRDDDQKLDVRRARLGNARLRRTTSQDDRVKRTPGARPASMAAVVAALRVGVMFAFGATSSTPSNRVAPPGRRPGDRPDAQPSP